MFFRGSGVRVRVSGPARERSCPPRSGGLWCGLLVPKKGQNAGLPACLIGAEVDLSTNTVRETAT